MADGGWRLFCELLDRCYEGVRIVLDHDPRRDRFVRVEVIRETTRVTLEMASTGMLQALKSKMHHQAGGSTQAVNRTFVQG